MKLRTACALVLIGSSLSACASGQERIEEGRLTATFHHVEESRPVPGRGTVVRAVETNCHPSRGSLLMKRIQEAESDPLKQRQARATIAILRKQMTVAEKRETAKLFRIQRNERKYLAAQARKEQRLAERELVRKLDDLDPHVRADAIVGLAALGTQSRQLGGRLLDRIDSPDASLHERTLAAWALPKIGFKHCSQKLLRNLELHPGPDAAELRVQLAEAIEYINDSFRVLVPLARRLLADEHPRCRMHGLAISERLLRRDRRLWSMLRPSVESLRGDERHEMRLQASRILDELQN